MKKVLFKLGSYPVRHWKDIAMAIVIFSGLTWWMQKDMLQTEAHVVDYSLPSLQGDFHPILDTQKNTLIYFFAPWCSICKLSMGNLSSVSSDINTVAVALEYTNRSEVKNFIDGLGVNVPVLMGNSQVAKAYKVNAFPSYYVIDKTGKVLEKSVGYSSIAGLLWRTNNS
jgi:thioredoxin-related protein